MLVIVDGKKKALRNPFKAKFPISLPLRRPGKKAEKKIHVQPQHQPAQQEPQPTPATPPSVAPPKAKEEKPKRKVSLFKNRVNRGTISLDPEKQLAQKKVKKEEEDDFSNMPSDAFSEEALKSAWKKYANSLKDDKIVFHHILIEDEPSLTGPNQIKYELSSESAALSFKAEKQGLLTYLRENLNNYHIQIETVVTEKEQTVNNLYTSADKYKFLIEKYPAIDELRKDLGLDLQ